MVARIWIQSKRRVVYFSPTALSGNCDCEAMDSVRKAKSRLWSYPKHLANCTPEASAYAKCISQYMGEVKKHQCDAEFQKFKQCVQNSAKKAGTKL